MKKYLYILLAGIIITSCGEGDEDNFPATSNNNNTTNNNGNSHINNGSNYASRIEIPALNDDDYFLTRCTNDKGKEKLNYAISFNAELKHSRWVAFTFDASNRDIETSRSNKWEDQEPNLPAGSTLTKKSISNTLGYKYNRGHLVASYDRLYSQEANEQTFYMSNISPMLASFNSSNNSLWDDLEQLINKDKKGWGRNTSFADTLYVVKGGTIKQGLYKKTDDCTIPNYYFMALLRLKDNHYHAIAFKLPHTDSHSGDIANYACSIDELEEFTDIDFFCNLKDIVEDAVESTYDPNSWNL